MPSLTQNAVQTSKDVVEAVRILSRVCTDEQIAGFLNRDGLLTGRGNHWTRALVASLRSKQGVACFAADRQREEGWLNLTAAAAALGTTNRTVRLAIDRGDIKAVRPLAHGPWVLNARDLPADGLASTVRTRSKTPAIPGPEQQSLDLSMT